MIERIKWALRAFEGLSELKINFNKYKLVTLNIFSHLAANFALQINCKLSSLPIKYLGLSLHWEQPSRHEWQSLIDKISKKTLNLEREASLFRGSISSSQICFIYYLSLLSYTF
jgi:hypothetical protein